MKICPRCSQVNYYNENKCVQCGADLSEVESKDDSLKEIKELQAMKKQGEKREFNKLGSKESYLSRINDASSMFDLYRLIYMVVLAIILLVGSIIYAVNIWTFLLYLLISIGIFFICIMILTIISGVLWSIHNHIELKYHIAKYLSNLENHELQNVSKPE